MAQYGRGMPHDKKRRHDLEALLHELTALDPKDPAVTAASILTRARKGLRAFLIKSLTPEQVKVWKLITDGKLYRSFPLDRDGALKPNVRKVAGTGSAWYYGYYDPEAWPEPSWQRVSNQTIASLVDRKLLVEPTPDDKPDDEVSDRGHRRVKVLPAKP